MPDPIHTELIRQAAEAARAGDREEARRKLEAVLEEDDENVTAWLLLARITENIDEKRMALTTVLQLDPKNERARKMMDRMVEEHSREVDEVLPGVSRRTLRLVLIASVGVVLVFLVIFITISNQESAAERNDANTATAQVLAVTRAAATTIAQQVEQTQLALEITETAAALVSPTPTVSPTRDRATLPPTFTSTPTLSNEGPTALPPLEGTGGTIIGWSGRDLQNNDALPLTFYALGGYAEGIRLDGVAPGRDAAITRDGGRVLYTQAIPSRTDLQVALVNAQGQPLESPLDQASGPGGYIESKMPQFSADGSRVVYIGESLNTGADEIFIVNLSGVIGDPATVTQVTRDTADYSYPVLSPDGRQVVAVRDDGDGPDLVVIDLNTRAPSFLTTDGAETLETTPRWSPDGGLIAYAAAPANQRRNHDIYLIAPDNPDGGFAAIQDQADDLRPVFSPDGRFLAFSSDRAASYEIFIYNLSSQELFQLTDNEVEDYPGGWIGS